MHRPVNIGHLHKGLLISNKNPMKRENDDDMTKAAPDSVDKKPYQKPEDAAIEDEIIESDIELDGELVEPDNGPPQKVCSKSI
ncbi:hypothetical protein BHM03_00037543 [Ensete ventricosum]|nr:hypothetical protein BHM03_00037543 [Ensete ventricosum]